MKSKRLVSMLVAAAMVAGSMPLTVFAGRLDYEHEETEVPQITETEEEKETSKPAVKETKPSEKETEPEVKETKPEVKETEPAETEPEETKETEPQETKETEETKEPEASLPDETEPSEPSVPAGSAGAAEEKLPEQTAKASKKNANSGSLGKSVTWSFDDSTGIITILLL